MKHIFAALLIFLLFAHVHATETYYVNEIKPIILRAVLSSQEITDQINKLARLKYKWTTEMIHVGSSNIREYQFTLFFEKKSSPTIVLRFDYDPANKKVTGLELMKEEDYKKSMGN